ncbi:neuromedin-U [Nematolebias whitei]|uniref:neuromedin-U n=1 Tax=Nematolebias whitei TaxID=451745 RepID=UPI001896B23F|nr:neuromedin-U [Nematolebias whitei]
MKSVRSPSRQPARHEALSSSTMSSSTMSSSTMSPLCLTLLLILTIPGSTCAPADLQQVTPNQRQLLHQIETTCSSYLSADLQFWASDILGELCVLMLVHKSKEQSFPENNKRFLFHYSRPHGSDLSQGSSQLHPLLHLVSQLHTRKDRGLLMRAELQGPGGIESRGYFLYRPRNGRRSLDYE